jgi:hypothetical protein
MAEDIRFKMLADVERKKKTAHRNFLRYVNIARRCHYLLILDMQENGLWHDEYLVSEDANEVWSFVEGLCQAKGQNPSLTGCDKAARQRIADLKKAAHDADERATCRDFPATAPLGTYSFVPEVGNWPYHPSAPSPYATATAHLSSFPLIGAGRATSAACLASMVPQAASGEMHPRSGRSAYSQGEEIPPTHPPTSYQTASTRRDGRLELPLPNRLADESPGTRRNDDGGEDRPLNAPPQTILLPRPVPRKGRPHRGALNHPAPSTSESREPRRGRSAARSAFPHARPQLGALSNDGSDDDSIPENPAPVPPARVTGGAARSSSCMDDSQVRVRQREDRLLELEEEIRHLQSTLDQKSQELSARNKEFDEFEMLSLQTQLQFLARLLSRQSAFLPERVWQGCSEDLSVILQPFNVPMEDRHAVISGAVDPAFRALMIRYFKDLSIEFYSYLPLLADDQRSDIEAPLSRLCQVRESDIGEEDEDEGREGRNTALQARIGYLVRTLVSLLSRQSAFLPAHARCRCSEDLSVVLRAFKVPMHDQLPGVSGIVEYGFQSKMILDFKDLIKRIRSQLCCLPNDLRSRVEAPLSRLFGAPLLPVPRRRSSRRGQDEVHPSKLANSCSAMDEASDEESKMPTVPEERGSEKACLSGGTKATAFDSPVSESTRIRPSLAPEKTWYDRITLSYGELASLMCNHLMRKSVC